MYVSVICQTASKRKLESVVKPLSVNFSPSVSNRLGFSLYQVLQSMQSANVKMGTFNESMMYENALYRSCPLYYSFLYIT